ncbi:hypothetical protein ACWGRK_03825 [Saccharomonospora azurea]|uniref:hypothetical protein n=1 Tax=Saccharomonospora azurea TaxID=40988 RepID=UPI00023FE9EC|nr:hypothetical protein [Saccharomonospora azurea]EHK89104.1 hypothetical protein SZMC14600_02019 [Saccharomonospora azurea SZMC 14600]
MLRPFAAYLRVYEPLSSFGDPPDDALLAAVERSEMTPNEAIAREQWLWLRSQVSATQTLPGETPDGRAGASLRTDVLVIEPGEVPISDDTVELASEPLVCPLEIRVRSAAALSSFLDDAPPALQAAVLDAKGLTPEAVKSRSSAALRDLYGSTMHVLSTNWTVPLPWFTIVDPDERRIVLGTGPSDPIREVSWRVAMADAMDRITEAEELVREALGEDAGPTRILSETSRWLSSFHPHSAVELDYGGLVQLIEDPVLATDTSADEVHTILDALRRESVEEVAEAFENLRDYWGELASRERFN